MERTAPIPATVMQARAALAAGSITARALVEHCLGHIAEPGGEGPRAFLTTYAEAARASADQIDRSRKEGAPLPEFAGIPISIKDLFDEAGRVNAAGSRVLADSPPANVDAVAIARLRAAGFIVLGRTNMTEFAYSGLGINPHFDTPLNPFDRQTGRISGGSSSGAAVSVSDRMALAGIGTDTGGSCRIPAALCGITGFKPTARRVPREGTVPLSTSLDSVGPLARSVECCRILDRVMSNGTDTEPARATLTGLSFAIPQALVFDGIDGAVARAFARAIARIASAGATVLDVPAAPLLKLAAINAKGGLTAAESFAWHRGLLENRGDAYDPRVRIRIEKGRSQSAADYIDTLIARAAIIAEMEAELAGFDAMLLPTVPVIAPTLASLMDDAEYGRVNLLMLRNPSVVNFLDGCAVSLPCHEAETAPVGLMVAGLSGQDARILSIAQLIETLLSAA